MIKGKYRISKKAVNDLEEIWEYTCENWSVNQADRYYKLIISEIEFIAKNSESGKSMDHIKEGYRATIVKSHLIFYRIHTDNNIEIIRILHQRMDVENEIK
jgi:toxin ParE1/3/4